ncbi:MAG: glycosyltransferase family 4 protein [Leptospirales bacterium]
MRIGIDAHVLGKGIGGVERFLKQVVDWLPRVAIDHEYVVFVNRDAANARIIEPQANVQIIPLIIANPLIERSLIMPWLARRHQLDMLVTQRLCPWFCGSCKLILTIHDLTPLKFPKAYRGLTNHLIRLLTGDSVRRSSLILTPTQTISDEVKARFKVHAKPIIAYYNGVDTTCFKPNVSTDTRRGRLDRLGIRGPYILTSGAIEARKNLETIYDAVASIVHDVPINLVVVGKIRDQGYAVSLARQARSLGIEDKVQKFGFVDEATLVELYQNASLFITASRDEGFDMPPLEAMSCGTPVICSDIPVHRELFDECALFFSPNSKEDLVVQIYKLLNTPEAHHQLREAASSLSLRFTWQAASKRIAAGLAGLS